MNSCINEGGFAKNAGEHVVGLSGKKILVVDDSEEVRDLLRVVLIREGCKITVSEDGAHAVQLLRDEVFDAVFLDISLPNIDGLQVASITRDGTINSKTPILFISGIVDVDAIEKLKTIKFMEVFVKPFEIDVILKKLAEKISSAEALHVKSYDARIIKGFLSAVQDVLRFYLENPPSFGSPIVKTSAKSQGFASIVIGLSGVGIVGSTSLTFERQLLHALAKKVFSDTEIQLSDELAGNLAGELGNQVCEEVKVNFAKLGLKVLVGLPEVVLGESHSLIHKASAQVISVPIQHSGSFCVAEFCIVTGERDESTVGSDAQDVIVF